MTIPQKTFEIREKSAELFSCHCFCNLLNLESFIVYFDDKKIMSLLQSMGNVLNMCFSENFPWNVFLVNQYYLHLLYSIIAACMFLCNFQMRIGKNNKLRLIDCNIYYLREQNFSFFCYRSNRSLKISDSVEYLIGLVKNLLKKHPTKIIWTRNLVFEVNKKGTKDN